MQYTPAVDSFRPITDKVTVALFCSLWFELQDARVFDLFAGSGQLGIEALSRGAQSAVFVDKSRQSAALAKQNLALCGIEAPVLCMDSLEYLKQCEHFWTRPMARDCCSKRWHLSAM